MKFVGGVRGEERDPTYFKYFEEMAKWLIRRREERLKSAQ